MDKIEVTFEWSPDGEMHGMTSLTMQLTHVPRKGELVDINIPVTYPSGNVEYIIKTKRVYDVKWVYRNGYQGAIVYFDL